MSASRSAANSPLRCSSHRSAASPSSPDDRQLARARLFLRRKRRTPTGPSSAPSPQQIALNDPLEASRAATAASLSSDRFRHRESISSCLPFSTVTQPALVLFPNQIRIYSQQAPSGWNGPRCFHAHLPTELFPVLAQRFFWRGYRVRSLGEAARRSAMARQSRLLWCFKRLTILRCLELR